MKAVVLIDCWQNPQSVIGHPRAQQLPWLDVQHQLFYELLKSELLLLDTEQFDIYTNETAHPVSEHLNCYPTVNIHQLTDYEHVYLAGCHLNKCIEGYSKQLTNLHNIPNSVVLNWSKSIDTTDDPVKLIGNHNYVWITGNRVESIKTARTPKKRRKT